MSTIYTFHQECPAITTAAAGDMVLLYDTSAGVTGKIAVSQLTGAGRIITGTSTTAATTATGQTALTHVITTSNVTIGDIVVASIDNGTNTTGAAVIRWLTPGAGTLTASIFNAATTATNPFGGTLVVNYAVFKQA